MESGNINTTIVPTDFSVPSPIVEVAENDPGTID